MGPAPVTEGIDSKSNRLEEHGRIKVPLPEQHEEQDVIQVSYPEIIFAVPAGHHHAGKACDDANQFEPADSGSSHCKGYVIDVEKIHYPTEPSSETWRSLVASTANSIGSRERTSWA